MSGPPGGRSSWTAAPLSQYRGACPVQLIWAAPGDGAGPPPPPRGLPPGGGAGGGAPAAGTAHPAPVAGPLPPRSCPAGSCSGSASPGLWGRPPAICCVTRSPPCWISSPRPRSGASCWRRSGGGSWACLLSATAPPLLERVCSRRVGASPAPVKFLPENGRFCPCGTGGNFGAWGAGGRCQNPRRASAKLPRAANHLPLDLECAPGCILVVSWEERWFSNIGIPGVRPHRPEGE